MLGIEEIMLLAPGLERSLFLFNGPSTVYEDGESRIRGKIPARTPFQEASALVFSL